jgi:hypothetical protein|nr:MAG TPA: hypothetical protein [Caudoviricetes sp.]
MYYQLTLQFATSEIDDAKKVLELAKELDLKRAGLEEKLPEPETFPWEEDAPTKETPTRKEKENETKIPMAKDWTTQDEPAHETVKPTPAPAPAPAQAQAPEPEKVREITLKDLQSAGVAFAKEKGMAVLKVFLTQMGASKISDIPKEKYQEAWEALHA